MTSKLRSLTMGERGAPSETSCGRMRPDVTQGRRPAKPSGPVARPHRIRPAGPDYAALEVLRAHLRDEGWREAFD
jgi:hypothetical protein